MASVTAEISMVRSRDGRTAHRRPLGLRALAREPQARPFPVTLVDLSTDGCRIAGEFALEQGTYVLIRLPGVGVRQARVAWAEPGAAGCEFDWPVAEEAIEQLAAAARARDVTGRLRSAGAD